MTLGEGWARPPNSGSPHKWFSRIFAKDLIKFKRGSREIVGSLQNQGGSLCLEPEEVGDILNEHFSREKDIVVGEFKEGTAKSYNRLLLKWRKY